MRNLRCRLLRKVFLPIPMTYVTIQNILRNFIKYKTPKPKEHRKLTRTAVFLSFFVAIIQCLRLGNLHRLFLPHGSGYQEAQQQSAGKGLVCWVAHGRKSKQGVHRGKKARGWPCCTTTSSHSPRREKTHSYDKGINPPKVPFHLLKAALPHNITQGIKSQLEFWQGQTISNHSNR